MASIKDVAGQELQRHNDGTPDGDSISKDTLTKIVHSIMVWPIESHTPMEAMNFLADIKRKLTQRT